MLGASRWLAAAPAAVDADAPLRLAISETVVADVNLNDARAAMQVYLERISHDDDIRFECSPKIFDTTQEILARARGGTLDAAALNVVEYRQIADLLDPSQIVTGTGTQGSDKYVILAKQDSGIRKLGDLRGRRLIMLKGFRMCVAPAWLSTLLDEGHHGPVERFFGSVVTDPKVSRVVLPVFFGQIDACLTSKGGFETMCELNPQVARDLTVLASSPVMVVTFYAFCMSYHGVYRERFAKALSGLRASAAGRQLATLFQFEGLTVTDAGCLAPAIAVLEKAERARSRPGTGNRKG